MAVMKHISKDFPNRSHKVGLEDRSEPLELFRYTYTYRAIPDVRKIVLAALWNRARLK